jgi:hypothetical protein
MFLPRIRRTRSYRRCTTRVRMNGAPLAGRIAKRNGRMGCFCCRLWIAEFSWPRLR